MKKLIELIDISHPNTIKIRFNAPIGIGSYGFKTYNDYEFSLMEYHPTPLSPKELSYYIDNFDNINQLFVNELHNLGYNKDDLEINWEDDNKVEIHLKSSTKIDSKKLTENLNTKLNNIMFIK